MTFDTSFTLSPLHPQKSKESPQRRDHFEGTFHPNHVKQPWNFWAFMWVLRVLLIILNQKTTSPHQRTTNQKPSTRSRPRDVIHTTSPNQTPRPGPLRYRSIDLCQFGALLTRPVAVGDGMGWWDGNGLISPGKVRKILIWLVVEPTHLKNISQIGSFPQVRVKIENIWNHHLVMLGTY